MSSLGPHNVNIVRHNQVARILQEVLQNDQLEFNPPEVTKKDHLEVW